MGAMPVKQAPETPCNCLAIRQAARVITQLYDRHLAAENLRTTQYSILSKLGRLGPLPINALAQSMAMDRTTLGRAVQPLERDRLIAIAADRDDRRVRIVRLTQAGQARLQAALPHWRKAQQEFEAGYGASEAASLRNALGRIVEAT
jgi:DNA-binding MarR family transcriptional regulator